MKGMKAMVVNRPGEPQTCVDRPMPDPGSGQIRLRVNACGVCRTDLHVVDGELPQRSYPIVPSDQLAFRSCDSSGLPTSRSGRRTGVSSIWRKLSHQ